MADGWTGERVNATPYCVWRSNILTVVWCDSKTVHRPRLLFMSGLGYNLYGWSRLCEVVYCRFSIHVMLPCMLRPIMSS